MLVSQPSREPDKGEDDEENLSGYSTLGLATARKQVDSIPFTVMKSVTGAHTSDVGRNYALK
jgi:hypothetical protein